MLEIHYLGLEGRGVVGMAVPSLFGRAVRAAQRFNEWMMGDLEMEILSVRDSEVKVLVRQGCACSLDFSLKEEVESAFRDEGLEVEARIEGWDVDAGGYRVTVRVLGER